MRLAPLLAFAVLLTSCAPPRDDDDDGEYEGDEPGECTDGADNDRDGEFDCGDAGCANSPDCAGDDDDDDDDDDDSTPGDDDDDDDDDSTAGPSALMYAHTSTQLFAVDPSGWTVTPVGTFSGQAPLFGVTDLALSLQGAMWAISFEGTYVVDPATGAMSQRGSWFPPAEYNALTFLTDGRLLAGQGSTLYEIDLTSGMPTSLGAIPGGLVFAGDMVGLPDGRLYCLMAPSATSGATSLVIYDPDQGQVVDTLPTGQGAMYGLGYASGFIYGFTEAGAIYRVNDATGAATSVASPGQTFWGAATNPTRWSE